MKVGTGFWLGTGFIVVELKDSAALSVDVHLSFGNQDLPSALHDRGEGGPVAMQLLWGVASMSPLNYTTVFHASCAALGK